MAQFVFKGRGKDDRTGHERIAMRNIRNAIGWVVGGFYNSLQDGNIEYLPDSLKSLENEVYTSAMNDLYTPGLVVCGKAPKEMRFAGAEFCQAYTHWKLSNDPDVKEIAEAAHWKDMEGNTREVFVHFGNEYALFNTDDVDGDKVIAQGQTSGRFYTLTLDDDLSVLEEEIYY